MNKAFDVKWMPEPNTGCWLWLASYNGPRYGGFKFRGKWQKAHRVSWQLYRGPIPHKMQVLHKCDTPLCVNPNHLFLGTPAENMADMWNKERAYVPKGSAHPNSKLTETDVREIREFLLEPHTLQKDIAAMYGVDPALIRRIELRKSWRHVE